MASPTMVEVALAIHKTLLSALLIISAPSVAGRMMRSVTSPYLL
jgi:hypothetical protein